MRTEVQLPDGTASCSLWWGEDVPAYRNYCPGVIGEYSAENDASASQLLQQAEERLRREGCDIMIGPMDGDTWHSYRFVTESNGRVPFFLEPENPPQYPEQFLAAGFSELAKYFSSEMDLAGDDQTGSSHGLNRVRSRMQQGCVSLRELNPSNFDTELQNIYEISIASFQDNFLYTPISFSEFAAMYEKVRPLIVPAFTILAEDGDGKPVGFVFAYPDGDVLIVKTLAVIPQRRLAGLGSLLVEEVQQAGKKAGFKRAIHALQYESNSSLKITARHGGEKFRTYTLFAKELKLKRG